MKLNEYLYNMKPKELNNLIESLVHREIKNKIIMETEYKKKNVYHISMNGQPVDTFNSMDEAKEVLNKLKKDHPGKQFIIEKGEYKSESDMIDKLDEMGEKLEEKENIDMKKSSVKVKSLAEAILHAKDNNIKKFKVNGETYDVNEAWGALEEGELCNECGQMEEVELSNDDLDEPIDDILGKDDDENFKELPSKLKNLDLGKSFEKMKKPESPSSNEKDLDELFGRFKNWINKDEEDFEEKEITLDKDDKDSDDETDMEKLSKAYKEMSDEIKYPVTESKNVCNECGSQMTEGVCNECGYLKEEDDEEKEDTMADLLYRKYSDDAYERASSEEFNDEYDFADYIIEQIIRLAAKNGDLSSDDEDENEEIIDDLKMSYGQDMFDQFVNSIGDDDSDLDDDSHLYDDDDMKNMMNESNKKVLRLKESEFIKTIEKIVKESKNDPYSKTSPKAQKGRDTNPATVKGLTVTKKAQSGSGQEAKSYSNEVGKKMKDYLSFNGNDNPEFPKQVGKGEKVAYRNTDKEEEFIDDYRGSGLQNLTYDNEPSEKFKDRLKKSIEGHSSMGNPSDAGNVVKSDLGKKILNQVNRKEEKKEKEPYYRKDGDPVRQFKPKKDYTAVNENKSNPSDKILKEEMDKIVKMYTYNKKTQ